MKRHAKVSNSADLDAGRSALLSQPFMGMFLKPSWVCFSLLYGYVSQSFMGMFLICCRQLWSN